MCKITFQTCPDVESGQCQKDILANDQTFSLLISFYMNCNGHNTGRQTLSLVAVRLLLNSNLLISLFTLGMQDLVVTLSHIYISCHIPPCLAYLLGHCHILNFANSMKGHDFWTNSIMTCQLV